MQEVINKLRERRRDGEEGFTLIELMVVVLIIAILLAIAIPTFLGARTRANDRAAQSSLRNSLTAAKTIYTDSQDYTSATPAALNAQEPNISHVATASADFKTVSVSTLSNVFAAAAKSKSGTCFMIKEVTVADTTYTAAGTFFGTNATCTGDQAKTSATATAW